MDDDLSLDTFPPAPRKPRGTKNALEKERKRMRTEMAAMAYVAMEFGDYNYRTPGEGRAVQKRRDPEGNIVPNKSEVMRVAGYRGKTIEMFNHYLGEDDYFWDLVELYRRRRTDPTFRYENTQTVWKLCDDLVARNLYERLAFYPHMLTVSDLQKAKQMITAKGIGGATGDGEDDRIGSVMNQLTPEQQKKALEGYSTALESELDRVKSLERSNRAAKEKADGSQGTL